MGNKKMMVIQSRFSKEMARSREKNMRFFFYSEEDFVGEDRIESELYDSDILK